MTAGRQAVCGYAGEKSNRGWQRRREFKVKAGFLAPCLLGFAGLLQAASLDVRVIDRDSRQPLSGAAICLGTSANPRQFGALRTDAYGQVAYRDLPEAPLVLTVSNDGYRGHRSQHQLRGFDLKLEVPLPSGGLGPSCDLPAVQADREQLAMDDERWLALEQVRVTRDAEQPQTVQLRLTARGEPTHYRLAASADLSDSRWQPYLEQVTWRESEGKAEALYLQLRRFQGDSGAVVERLSAVRRVLLR